MFNHLFTLTFCYDCSIRAAALAVRFGGITRADPLSRQGPKNVYRPEDIQSVVAAMGPAYSDLTCSGMMALMAVVGVRPSESDDALSKGDRARAALGTQPTLIASRLQ